MALYAVIGTSPFHDTSVACGPYRSNYRSVAVSEQLEAKGWNTEIVQLLTVHEIPVVTNDE